MSKEFKLSSELMDQIIFAMENQKETFLLDTETLLLRTESSVEPSDGETLIPLPDWTPSDGYQLMDSFTGTLKNPVYRERLSEILRSGRGVFRGFKNVLKERSDLEKAWFAHKDREMKRRVRDWYAELCDYWGIQSIGEEPEETDDLFLDEFSMEVYTPGEKEFESIRESFRTELFAESPAGLKSVLERQSSWSESLPDLAVRAVSPGGNNGGYISLFLQSEEDGLYGIVDVLYVLPEFRGAGIAAGLMDFLVDHCYHNGVETLLMVLPPEGEVLRRNLERRGFRTVGPCLLLNLEQWFFEQQNHL
ncbi:MAG: GNAT family N-acetyltransferase [Spirochaetales bacterium]|nr:GNAT family N-acetyltransferase [Spirochaetales bacterium]